MRGSEVDLLERVARFRAVFVEDIASDAPNRARVSTDLRLLEYQGLVETRTLARLRDGHSAEVVSVTEPGKSLLDAHRDPDRDQGQQYYAGWVKQAELWHDASLYRMTLEVENEVERDGGHVRRMILDDELKARAFRALHEMRQQRGESDPDARTIVAHVQGLALKDGHFVFPDVRLEIEDVEGNVRTLDLEMVTEHYHRGHLGGKAGAGFRMFGGRSAAERKGGTPHDDRVIGRLLR